MPATMSIADTMLAEFEQELTTTRRFLERLPADRLTWKPHDKSMTAGQLARHIAEAPGVIAEAAMADEFEMPNFEDAFPQPTSTGEVIEAMDGAAEKVRAALGGFDDARMLAPWRVVKDGNVVMEMPRMVFVRNIMFNHTYHHRGQFGVYLRLMGAKVPSVYGPSGDEGMDGKPLD